MLAIGVVVGHEKKQIIPINKFTCNLKVKIPEVDEEKVYLCTTSGVMPEDYPNGTKVDLFYSIDKRNFVHAELIENGPNISWNYVKELKSLDLVLEFQELTGYWFDDYFRGCVRHYNGGRPNRRTFSTDKAVNRELKTFLSFNKTDKENVWNAYKSLESECKKDYIPFAVDNFGNLICINQNDNRIYLVNHENEDVEFVNKSFAEFMGYPKNW